MFLKILVDSEFDLDDSDDGALIGTYQVEVSDSVPEGNAVTAALDGFHGQFGIDEVDVLNITVHDDETGAILPEHEDAKSGTMESYCINVEKISDDLDQECVNSLKSHDASVTAAKSSEAPTLPSPKPKF